MKARYHGEVNDEGTLYLFNRNGFREILKNFAGKRVTLTLETRKADPKTWEQIKYYRGCFLPMVQEGLQGVGYIMSLEDVHEFLLHRFATVDLVNRS